MLADRGMDLNRENREWKVDASNKWSIYPNSYLLIKFGNYMKQISTYNNALLNNFWWIV